LDSIEEIGEIHINKFKGLNSTSVLYSRVFIKLLFFIVAEMANNRDFLARVCSAELLPDGRHIYDLNLFNDDDSVLQTLINDCANVSRSNMEESMQSVYDVTINDATMMNNTVNNSLNQSIDITKKQSNFQPLAFSGTVIPGFTKTRPDHREFQQIIHDDATSPFPVHENFEKPKVFHTIITS